MTMINMKILDLFKSIFNFKKNKFIKKNNSEFKKTCIIINPKAGRNILLNLTVNIVLNKFKEHKISYELFYTKYEGQAIEIAKIFKDKIDFFTVLGGDGTIREVVEGMIDNPKPIGIIPTGTVNVLALELNLPFLATHAVDTIINGYTKKIDIGLVNNKPFILMTSAGIDALAVHNVNLKVKKIFGKITYLISGIKSFLTYKPHLMKIYIEDINIIEYGYLVIISNSKFYGGKFQIDSDASIDDGILNLFIFKNHGFLNTIRLFLGVITGLHKAFNDCKFYKCKKIKLESEKKVYMQIDGDKAPPPPAYIEIKEKFLEIFLPNNKDFK